MGCDFPNCTNVRKARGYCSRHYEEIRRGGRPTAARPRGGRQINVGPCENSGCDRPQHIRHLCARHYRYLRLNGTPEDPIRPKRPSVPCAFAACEGNAKARGLCLTHYSQQRKGKPLAPVRVPADRLVTAQGYVRVRRPDHPNASPSGWLLEHHVVLTQHLGRALRPGENVHHLNGQRDDNRLENLELWSTHQPKGQRIADKVRWAREVLDMYADELVQHPEVLGG